MVEVGCEDKILALNGFDEGADVKVGRILFVAVFSNGVDSVSAILYNC